MAIKSLAQSGRWVNGQTEPSIGFHQIWNSVSCGLKTNFLAVRLIE